VAVHAVGDPALQREDSFLVRLAFGDLAVVEGAAFASGADLRDCGEGLVMATACSTSEDISRSTTSSSSATSTTAAGPSTAANGSSSNADASVPTATLAEVIQRAVHEERNAEATYQNVIAALGPIQPFVNISDSEAQHVADLEQLARKYGVDISNITAAGAPSPADKRAACTMGVGAERADIALYDELLPLVTDHPDVVQVLTNLRTASQDNHLPAFERCA
jgi:hypothetical protein